MTRDEIIATLALRGCWPCVTRGGGELDSIPGVVDPVALVDVYMCDGKVRTAAVTDEAMLIRLAERDSVWNEIPDAVLRKAIEVMYD